MKNIERGKISQPHGTHVNIISTLNYNPYLTLNNLIFIHVMYIT